MVFPRKYHLLSSLLAVLALVPVATAETLFPGLGFSPLMDGQSPSFDVPPEQIQTRMEIMAPYAGWVRTWGCNNGLQNVPAIARGLGLNVAACAYITGDPIVDNEQIDNLLTAAIAGNVDIAVVGNEFLVNDPNALCPRKHYLIERLDEVRYRLDAAGLLDIPVATAEPYGDWAISQPGGLFRRDPYSHTYPNADLLNHVDTLLVHLYPFHEGEPIDSAVARLADMFNQVVALVDQLAPGREVVIGETGWPTAGDTNGLAVPSLENAQLYAFEVAQWSWDNGVLLFYFEFSDELWKPPGYANVEQHWGLFYSDGTPKYLLEQPHVDLAATQIDFGPVLIGQPRTCSLLITNNSQNPAYLHNFQFQGDTGHFSIDMRPLLLAPGARKDLKVTSSRSEPGEMSDVLYLSINGLEQQVNLSAHANCIAIVDQPVWGSPGRLTGRTAGIQPRDYYVQAYINVFNWYTKPWYDKSQIPITASGAWIANIQTVPSDRLASQVAVNLVPNEHVPDIANGLPNLPDGFDLYPLDIAYVPNLQIRRLFARPGRDLREDSLLLLAEAVFAEEHVHSAAQLTIVLRHHAEILLQCPMPFGGPDSLRRAFRYRHDGSPALNLTMASRGSLQNRYLAKMVLSLRHADLSGLRDPITLDVVLHNATAAELVSETATVDAYTNSKPYPRQQMPSLEFLDDYMDAIEIDRVLPLRSGQGFAITGRIATSTQIDLANRFLFLRWGDHVFTVFPGDFLAGARGTRYSCKGPGPVTGYIDVVSGRFALNLSAADLNWQEGSGYVGLTCCHFNESAFLVLP